MLVRRATVGGPEPILRGEDVTLDLYLRDEDGGPCTLTAGSSELSIYDSGGTLRLLCSCAADSADPGHLTAEIASSDSTSWELGVGWRGIWRVAYDPSDLTILRNVPIDMAVCRYVPVPSVTSEDLYDRHSTLRRELPEGQSNWAPQLRQAWITITQRLFAQGRRHWLIVSQGSLRDVEIAETLAIIYNDARSLDPRYDNLADRYRKLADDAWAALRFDYDLDDDGVADEQESATAVLSFSAGPRTGFASGLRRYGRSW